MNMSAMRQFLLSELLDEKQDLQLGNTADNIPGNTKEQDKLIRSLINVRPPAPVTTKFLKIQDRYLQELTKQKGIIDIEHLSPVPGNQKIILWQGDITRLTTDAIVNAANSQMLGCFVPCHGCIDNVIHTFAGVQLRLECHHLMQQQERPEPTGKAKITAAYNLPCKYVIHTVGPIIDGTLTKKDCNLLRDCYISCLKIAEDNNIKSIAFCCISTGEFHFPNEEAAQIAIETVSEYLNGGSKIEKVVFNVFKDKDREIYQKILAGNPH